jgi:apolipoprotein N-acyltransferase
MSENLSSFRPYPKEPGSELPPPRRDWGAALWIGFALLVAAGLGALLWWLAPGLWVLALAPDSLLALAGIVAVCALLLLAVLVYAWQRSERQDK